MSDNVAITAGSGTTIAADEVADGTLGTVKVQYVKLMDGTLDGTSKAAVGANGLKVDASGVGLAADSSVNGLLVGQGSTTSGQNGPLIQGSVTTAAPSYTNGQTIPIALTTSGQVRTVSNVNQINGATISTAASGVQKVGVADGSGTALTSTGSALDVNLKTSSITVNVAPPTAATGTQTSVASSASSVTVLASNAKDRGATVYNDSTQVLYLLLVTGGTASTTAYSVQIGAGAYYEVPFRYTGALIGIWASANGNARVTEFTA